MQPKMKVFMKDFAGSDPRSVKAWLKGGGDGRFEEAERQARVKVKRDARMVGSAPLHGA